MPRRTSQRPVVYRTVPHTHLSMASADGANGLMCPAPIIVSRRVQFKGDDAHLTGAVTWDTRFGREDGKTKR